MSLRAVAAEPGVPPADPLVERARGGDLGAFETLYRQHVGRVYALCLRMTAEPSRAEDATQETFVRAWQKLETFRGEAGFSTWLRRVAINTVLGDSRARSRRRDREHPLADPDPIDRRGGEAAPGAALDLEQAITALPERARAVFVLHDVEGYRHEEIGGLLGVSPGTSKSQLHRARSLLREALES